MKRGKRIFAICLVLVLLCTGGTGALAAFKDRGSHLDVGMGYYYGTGESGFDIDEADSSFFFADDPLASYYAGLVETYSTDTDRYRYAMDYFQDAWDEGCALGLVGMGLFYEFGLGVLPGYREALEYFQHALDEDCVEANYGMGCLYLNGHGVKQDRKKARGYFEKAVRSEDYGFQNDALIALASMATEDALEGNGDFTKALEYLEQAMDNDYRDAIYQMGWMYEMGYGVKQNTKRALRYYQQAADMGCAYACNALGMAYYNGAGVEKDPEQAAEWFTLGAEYGYGLSMSNLGYMYMNGIGVEEDWDTAMDWYEAAAWSADAEGMFIRARELAATGDIDDAEEALWWFFNAQLRSPGDEDVIAALEEALDNIAEMEELKEEGFTREYLSYIAYGWDRMGEYLWISPELEGELLTEDDLYNLSRTKGQTILRVDTDFTGTIRREGEEIAFTWTPDTLICEDEIIAIRVDGDYLTLSDGTEELLFKRFYAPW